MGRRQSDKHNATPSTKPENNLAQQYGGKHTGKWVSQLPSSWIPFIQLARLSPPAGVALVFFPHFFGLVHAYIMQPIPLGQALSVGGLVALYSFFLSNGCHAWNDLVDVPIDRLVARTKGRPIVRGAVTPRGAILFSLSQIAGCGAVLLALPVATAITVAPSVLINIYYPYSKRHTSFTQFVLGSSLAWGVNVGTAAMGVVPWAPDVLPQTASLFAVSVLWTVIYDTIYAFQDIEDDIKTGVNSTAVFFNENAKNFLWVCLSLLVGLLYYYGLALNLGIMFYAPSIGGCVASLGAMVANVDLKDPASCWWWFRYGFWLAGGSIAGALLLQLFL